MCCLSRVPTPVGRLRDGDHLCLPYDNDDERQALISTFVSDGLSVGQQVVYVADRPERLLGGLRGFDVTAALDSGRLVLQAVADVAAAAGGFHPDRMAHGLRETLGAATAQGFAGVRMAGEMLDWLPVAGAVERLVELEVAVQEVFDSGLDVIAVCQYDRRRLDAPAVLALEGLHRGPVTVDPIFMDAQLRVTPTFAPRGVRLEGDLDASNSGRVRGVLRAAGGPADLHIDLAALEFIDAAGLRALVTAPPAVGGRVVLHTTPPCVMEALRLTGLAGVPHLVLAEAPASRNGDRHGEGRATR